LGGGEDEVVTQERSLLRRKGNTVIEYDRDNSELKCTTFWEKIGFIKNVFYNNKTITDMQNIVGHSKVDIVHVHNFWPLISPSIFYFLNKQKIPWVLTLHNYRHYRLIKPNALLSKDDIKKTRSNNNQYVVRHKFRFKDLKSYKESFLLTFLYWVVGKFIKITKVLENPASRIIVLNAFCKSIFSSYFSDGDLRIVVKGNFFSKHEGIEQNSRGDQYDKPFFLYLGRISKEKGILTLLNAFLRFKEQTVSDFQLILVGEGPLLKPISIFFSEHLDIKFLGFLSGFDKENLMRHSTAIVIPSEWQELFPMTILEAYSYQKPVIAANIGGLPEIVKAEVTGLLFESGNLESLQNILTWSINNLEKLKKYGEAGKLAVSTKYSSKTSYHKLFAVYKSLLTIN